MEFTIKDNLRFLVETQSNYTNTVMYDDYGNPNIMVRLDKIVYDDVDFGSFRGDHKANRRTHGAFVLEDGKEINEIWVSKYINAPGNGGVPISLPNTLPMIGESVLTAREKSFKKGKGWHLMTNIEWSAVIAYCHAMKRFPDVDPTNNGSHVSVFDKIKKGSGDIVYHYAGNGTMWSAHNTSEEGIFDMAGVLWQWVDGFRVDKYGQGGMRFFGEDGVPMNLFTSNKYTTYGDMHIELPSSADLDEWYIDVDPSYGGAKTSTYTTFGKYNESKSSIWYSKMPKYGYKDEYKTRCVMSELGILIPPWADSSPDGNLLLPGLKYDYSHPLAAARGGRIYNGSFSLPVKSTIYDLSFLEKETSTIPQASFRTCYIDMG